MSAAQSIVSQVRVNVTRSAAGTINVNGQSYVGRNIIIRGDKVIIDGVEQSGDASGPVTVNITGDVELIDTASGNVNVKGTTGPIQSVSGDVKADVINGHINTISGDVTAETITGHVNTLSGDISRGS